MKNPFPFLLLFFFLTSCPPRQTIPEDIPEEIEEPVPLIPGAATFEYWIHEPLHPGNNQAVDFLVKANDPEKIKRVELAIYEYELYENDLGLPSKRKRTNGYWGIVDAFEPTIPIATLEHRFTLNDGFPAASNVEYIFTIIALDGSRTRQMAMFDAGNSLWPKDKILLYSTVREPLDNTINLCFFPDTDYEGNWPGFLEDTKNLIFQGYHQNNKIKDKKERWSFYYTQHQTDGQALSENPFNPDFYPAFMKDSIIQGIDAFGLLHQKAYRDGAYLNSNIQFLAQSVFTSESYNWGTAIHETAHAIFHLSDEYDGCACFASRQESNIFRERSACEAFNLRKGFPSGECTEILNFEGQPWYLPERPPFFTTEEACRAFNIQQGLPADSCRLFQKQNGALVHQAFNAGCIMQDDGDAKVPAFRHACSASIDRYYEQLIPPDTEPIDWVLAEAVDNFFGYEPVIMLMVNMGMGELELSVTDIRYGVPKKNIGMATDLRLSLPGLGGTAYQLNLDRPDCLHIHYGDNKALVQTAEQMASCHIALPMLTSLTQIICEDYSKGGSAQMHAVNLQKEILKKIKDFKRE